MKSCTLPSFWEKYRRLDKSIQERARKAFKLWIENPFHPSLHFKCINAEENIWAVRINLGYRVLGVLDEDTVTWFWVGSHDEYEKYFG
jgi:mRNA-degrading endonuclease RelE of RelBE toxin-antitoxin system